MAVNYVTQLLVWSWLKRLLLKAFQGYETFYNNYVPVPRNKWSGQTKDNKN